MGIVASLSHFELSPDEHREMMRKWLEWLKPGGYYLLSTIATVTGEEFAGTARSFDQESGCADGVKTNFMGNNILVTVFTHGGWRKLFEDAGFEIVSTEEKLFVSKSEITSDEPRFYIIARKPVGA